MLGCAVLPCGSVLFEEGFIILKIKNSRGISMMDVGFQVVITLLSLYGRFVVPSVTLTRPFPFRFFALIPNVGRRCCLWLMTYLY